MMSKPSAPQLQALEDVERYGSPYNPMFGQAENTVRSIQRHGWIAYDEADRRWALTALGRAVLHAARE